MRPPKFRSTGRAGARRGQSLVEFSLVFPLFWLVLVGLIEFSFAFNAVLTVSLASRDAAVVASEAGNAPTADCSILRVVELDVTPPTNANQIQTVDIYWTDSNGVVRAGATTTYTRNVATPISCTVNSVKYTVPYTQSIDGYPMANRCSTRTGCAGHAGLDTVGVRVSYTYTYHTPYGTVLGGTGWNLQRASEMRVEPYQ